MIVSAERREVLASLAAHLTEARGLAKRAEVDFSLVSEIDHVLKVALFNLAEERGAERGGSAVSPGEKA